MTALQERSLVGVRLLVEDRWVVSVPLDHYDVRPVHHDGTLGPPADGLSAPHEGPLRISLPSGEAVADAVAAGFAEPDTDLRPDEVGALAPELAGLLSACATFAAAARGRALLAAAHRGIAADVAAARQADRDVSVWRTVHATSVHAAGTPLAAVPDWLRLEPRDAAIAWRAGVFGAAPAPADPAPLTAGRPVTSDPQLSRDPVRVLEQARAQQAAQQGHGYAKPTLSVGLTAAMALALTGCGADVDEEQQAQVQAQEERAVCIDQQTQEVLSDEFCDEDGPRAYGGGGGFALLVFGGNFFRGPGGKQYARGYSTTRPPGFNRRSTGSGFGGGSRGSGG